MICTHLLHPDNGQRRCGIGLGIFERRLMGVDSSTQGSRGCHSTSLVSLYSLVRIPKYLSRALHHTTHSKSCPSLTSLLFLPSENNLYLPIYHQDSGVPLPCLVKHIRVQHARNPQAFAVLHGGTSHASGLLVICTVLFS